MRELPRRFAGKFTGGTARLISFTQSQNLKHVLIQRIVSDHQEPAFEVIEELLMDKTIKFSMLAGQAPVLERVKGELTNYWEREAKKGRYIEEIARYMNNCL